MRTPKKKMRRPRRMILTQQRPVKMKKKIIKMCTSNSRQLLKQLPIGERCSWNMRAVKKKRKIPAVMEDFLLDDDDSDFGSSKEEKQKHG